MQKLIELFMSDRKKYIRNLAIMPPPPPPLSPT